MITREKMNELRIKGGLEPIDHEIGDPFAYIVHAVTYELIQASKKQAVYEASYRMLMGISNSGEQDAENEARKVAVQFDLQVVGLRATIEFFLSSLTEETVDSIMKNEIAKESD